jgi:hypothetical protein
LDSGTSAAAPNRAARTPVRRTLAGVRQAGLAFVVLALIAPAGCDSSPDEPKKPDPLHSYDGRVIRGWLLALERQDYEQAAYYFAPGALIDQGRPYRLRTKSDAFAFNASLPCRADLIRLKGSGHAHHVLATFRLRAGPGGACSGLVRVRYTIRKGKFTEWRQLEEPEGQPA